MSDPKRKPSKKKGAHPDQESAPSRTTSRPNNTSYDPASAGKDILDNKSTATEVQLKKLMALLQSGPNTTMQLREHGIMMPASRIHRLRHKDRHQIEKDLVTLYDSNGFCHSKCALYFLVAEAGAGGAA